MPRLLRPHMPADLAVMVIVLVAALAGAWVEGAVIAAVTALAARAYELLLREPQ